MSTASGLGVAALVIAIIGAFTPIIGLYVGWAALLIACISALLGDKGLTIATVAVSAPVFLFLTPSLWVNSAASALASETNYPGPDVAGGMVIVTGVLLLAPIVCIFLSRRKIAKTE